MRPVHLGSPSSRGIPRVPRTNYPHARVRAASERALFLLCCILHGCTVYAALHVSYRTLRAACRVSCVVHVAGMRDLSLTFSSVLTRLRASDGRPRRGRCSASARCRKCARGSGESGMDHHCMCAWRRSMSQGVGAKTAVAVGRLRGWAIGGAKQRSGGHRQRPRPSLSTVGDSLCGPLQAEPAHKVNVK